MAIRTLKGCQEAKFSCQSETAKLPFSKQPVIKATDNRTIPSPEPPVPPIRPAICTCTNVSIAACHSDQTALALSQPGCPTTQPKLPNQPLGNLQPETWNLKPPLPRSNSKTPFPIRDTLARNSAFRIQHSLPPHDMSAKLRNQFPQLPHHKQLAKMSQNRAHAK